MKSYSEQFFLPLYRSLREAAASMVSVLEEETELLRCHEVTRAVAHLLHLNAAVRDGLFGHVDHSWLELVGDNGRRVVLDVYSVGRLPMVQLVDTSTQLLPYASLYKPRTLRRDVRVDVLYRLINQLKDAGFSIPEGNDS